MGKLTKKRWIEEVISYLSSRKDAKAKLLIEDYNKLEEIAEQKRKSAKFRRMMNSIQNKETTKISKAKKEEALQLIDKVKELLD